MICPAKYTVLIKFKVVMSDSSQTFNDGVLDGKGTDEGSLIVKNYVHPRKTIRATGYLPKLCSNSSSYHYPPRSKLSRCRGQEVGAKL